MFCVFSFFFFFSFEILFCICFCIINRISLFKSILAIGICIAKYIGLLLVNQKNRFVRAIGYKIGQSNNSKSNEKL